MFTALQRRFSESSRIDSKTINDNNDDIREGKEKVRKVHFFLLKSVHFFFFFLLFTPLLL